MAWSVPAIVAVSAVPAHAAASTDVVLSFGSASYSGAGGSQVTGVTVKAVRNGVGLAGVAVTVSVSAGYTFPGGGTSETKTTDGSGVASFSAVTVPASGAAGTFSATASGASSVSAAVTGSESAKVLTFSQTAYSVAGGSQFTPTVTVTYAVGGAVLSGQSVKLTLPSGLSFQGGSGTTLTEQTATTNASGVATFPAVNTPAAGQASANMTAALGSVTKTAAVTVAESAKVLTFNQASYSVGGGTQFTPTVTVTYANGGAVLSGQSVKLTLPSGLSFASGTAGEQTVTTNASGVATFPAVNTPAAGQASANMTAALGSVTKTAAVTVTESAKVLTFNQASYSIGGGTQFTPTVTVTYANGGAVLSGQSVKLTLPSGLSFQGGSGATLTEQTVATNASGVATFPAVNTPAAGQASANMTAALGSVTKTAAVTVTESAKVLTFNQTSYSIGGGTQFTPTVTVTYANGGAVLSGQSVKLTLPSGLSFQGGSGATLTEQTVATNASGVATFPAVNTPAAGQASANMTAALGSVTKTAAVTVTESAKVLTFNQTSYSIGGGTQFTPTVTVTYAVGGAVLAGQAVKLTLPSGLSFASGTAGEQTVTTNASGVATFPAVNTPAAGQASANMTAALGSVTKTAAVTVTESAKTLVFAPTSYSGTGGTQITTMTTKLTYTTGGSVVSGKSVTVTLPSGFTFSNGTATATATTNASGIATFTPINTPVAGGSGSATAASTGATNATATLTVAEGPKTLVFSPTSYSGTGGTNITTMTVKLTYTADGSAASGKSVTVTLPSGFTFSNNTATLTATTNTSGVATFNPVRTPNAGGSGDATASSSGATDAVAAIDVAEQSKKFTAWSWTPGTPITNMRLTLKYTNNAVAPDRPVTLSLPSGFTFAGSHSQTETVNTNSSGVANFSNITTPPSGGSGTMTGSAPGATNSPVTSELTGAAWPTSNERRAGFENGAWPTMPAGSTMSSYVWVAYGVNGDGGPVPNWPVQLEWRDDIVANGGFVLTSAASGYTDSSGRFYFSVRAPGFSGRQAVLAPRIPSGIAPQGLALRT